MAAVSPSVQSQCFFTPFNYNDNLHYCLPRKCIIVVQHLMFHTSIEKLSAALKRKIHPETERAVDFTHELQFSHQTVPLNL